MNEIHFLKNFFLLLCLSNSMRWFSHDKWLFCIFHSFFSFSFILFASSSSCLLSLNLVLPLVVHIIPMHIQKCVSVRQKILHKTHFIVSTSVKFKPFIIAVLMLLYFLWRRRKEWTLWDGVWNCLWIYWRKKFCFLHKFA